MDLLKYVEPMKHLPERFSNLAFWRGVRKFKDDVVNALEYVDSWGTAIESEIDGSSTFIHMGDTSSGMISIDINYGSSTVTDNTFGFTQVSLRSLYDYTNPYTLTNAKSVGGVLIWIKCVNDGNIAFSTYMPVPYIASKDEKGNIKIACPSVFNFTLPITYVADYSYNIRLVIYHTTQ